MVGTVGERGLGYQPALDGLRAIAVLAVVCFHGGLPWASGGYLGVSVFFTLSGFLITSLLVAEIDDRGSVDLGRVGDVTECQVELLRSLPAAGQIP
ncbi:MAG TPA: hypothetical protein PLV68_11460, partial [Ilumatobacteraceae bacterium]|nr:hypothetical protein [Ilumatobacteraceae bacterium]